MAVTAEMVKELHKQTGAGMIDCRKALTETNGDIEKTIDLLREKSPASVAKEAGRIVSEGLVGSYIHGGRTGVLIEVNSETDFTAKNGEFRSFVKDMAIQVAAVNPKYVSREEVPAELTEHEREVLTEQARHENKPEKIIEKMVEGRLEKYYEKTCLLDQHFIKDGDLRVQDVLNNLISKIGENIKTRRPVRFGVREDLEKKEEDFAEEVTKRMGTNE